MPIGFPNLKSLSLSTNLDRDSQQRDSVDLILGEDEDAQFSVFSCVYLMLETQVRILL